MDMGSRTIRGQEPLVRLQRKTGSVNPPVIGRVGINIDQMNMIVEDSRKTVRERM